LVTLEKARVVLMKYIVQLEVEVEADNDDAALFWVQDAVNMYGVKMSIHRWMRTTIKGENE